MPVYKFTSPDGRKYRVTAPDGATQQQAFQMLQKQLGNGAGSQEQPATSGEGRQAADQQGPKDTLLQSFNRGVVDLLSMPQDLSDKMMGAIVAEEKKRHIPESSRAYIGMPKNRPGDLRPAAEHFGIIGAHRAQGILPLAAEFAGSAVVPELAVGAKGAQVLRDVAPAARSVWQEVAAQTARTPVKALAADAAGSAGAATGGEVTKRFTNNPSIIALGELAGGFAPAGWAFVSPTVRAARMAPKLIEPFTASGAERRAAARLQSVSQNPEAAAAKVGSAPEYSAARQTQDPGLMALEKAILDADPAKAADVARSVAEARRQAQSEATFGSQENIRPALSASLEAPIRKAATIAGRAARKATDAINRLGPNASARDISEITHDAIESAYRRGRTIEGKLWDKVDQGAPANAANARAALDNEILSRSKFDNPEDIPKWLREALSSKDELPDWAREAVQSGKAHIVSGAEGTGQPQTLGDLRSIRSRVLQEAREERAKPAPNRNKLRILDDVQSALLDDMGESGAGGPLDEARAFSRAFNERFTTGKIGQLRGYERSGGERVDPRDTLDFILSGRGTAASAQQMVNASPETKQLLEHYLKASFLAQAVDEGGVNAAAANRFIDRWRQKGIFELYPGLEHELKGVTSLSQGAKRLGLRAADIKRLAFHSGKSRAALYLNAPIGDEMHAVLGAKDPDAVARSLRRRVRGDMRARQGLKTAFAEELMKQSRTGYDETGAPIVSGARFDRLLNEYSSTAKALGMTDPEVARLSNIAQRLKLAEQHAGNLKQPVMSDATSTILDLLARIVGARIGQHLGGEGMGASLVLAQAGSKQVRGLLGRLTRDRAEELLVAAHQDPELYRALLTKTTASAKRQAKAVSKLNAWIAGIPAEQQGDSSDTDQTANVPGANQEGTFAAPPSQAAIDEAASTPAGSRPPWAGVQVPQDLIRSAHLEPNMLYDVRMPDGRRTTIRLAPDGHAYEVARNGSQGQTGAPANDMPEIGWMKGQLHLNPALAPKVPAGAPRPLAPGEYIENPSGTWSSEITATVTDPRLNGGEPTVIPSLWLIGHKPYRLTEDQAVSAALRSGLHFHAFPTMRQAEQFATEREHAWQNIKPSQASHVLPLWTDGTSAPAAGHGTSTPAPQPGTSPPAMAPASPQARIIVPGARDVHTAHRRADGRVQPTVNTPELHAQHVAEHLEGAGPLPHPGSASARRRVRLSLADARRRRAEFVY